MADMNGQVALVTGGTRGIGLAICERLINRGVTVAAGYAGRHDHAREFADKYADQGVSIHQGNIGHNEGLRAGHRRGPGPARARGHPGQQRRHHGGQDGAEDDPRGDRDHVIHVNLSGAFYLSRRRSGGGHAASSRTL